MTSTLFPPQSKTAKRRLSVSLAPPTNMGSRRPSISLVPESTDMTQASLLSAPSNPDHAPSELPLRPRTGSLTVGTMLFKSPSQGLMDPSGAKSTVHLLGSNDHMPRSGSMTLSPSNPLPRPRSQSISLEAGTPMVRNRSHSISMGASNAEINRGRRASLVVENVANNDLLPLAKSLQSHASQPRRGSIFQIGSSVNIMPEEEVDDSPLPPMIQRRGSLMASESLASLRRASLESNSRRGSLLASKLSLHHLVTPEKVNASITTKQHKKRIILSDQQKQDGSGSMDANELRIVMRALGFHPTKHETQRMVAEFFGKEFIEEDEDDELQMDVESDESLQEEDKEPGDDLMIKSEGSAEEDEDTLNVEQFIQIMAQKMAERDGREEMLVAFRLFDTEHRGRIGLKDLRRVAKELDEVMADDELLMILDESDKDRDGEIGEEDWIRVMAKS